VLDHVAHYVEDLGAAGALLEQLGFAPTAVSNHQIEGKPSGTANRCLMLPEGYIEILALRDKDGENAEILGHLRDAATDLAAEIDVVVAADSAATAARGGGER